MITTKIPASHSNKYSELRLSPRFVSFFLVMTGFLIAIASDIHTTPAETRGLLFALICFLMAGLIEFTSHWQPEAGRWTAVILVTLLIPLGGILLTSVSFLALMPIPVIIAVALIGVQAGGITGAIESCVVTLLLLGGLPPFEVAAAGAAIASIWITFGILAAVYAPMIRIESWSQQYVLRAQELLDEARDRNADLDQVLNDLAHVNRQLDIANERLKAAQFVAEDSRRAKSMFVAKVSHELRTPLNMIIGLSDFLLNQVNRNGEGLPLDILKDVQIIHRNSEHLSRMINDVLDLSQTEAGRLVLHRQWVNMTEEIRDAVSVVKPLLDKKGLFLSVVVEERLPEVYCDPIRIRQVILNLVSNAGRYTEKGYVRIEAKREDRNVTVSVRDTGSGIPEQDLVQIFEPFYQENQSGAPKGIGSGLGLAVSKQFIEQHSGSIWAESEPGKGSLFAFSLPLSPLAAPIASASGWINEEWVWKERNRNSELPKHAAEWRVIICDESGRIYPLFTKVIASEIELVETQNIDQVMAHVKDIPAHIVIFHEDDPLCLDRKLLEARLLIPDTPIVGCSMPITSKHRETPDIIDYLIKPITRADLRHALETLPKPARRVLVTDDDEEVRDLFSRMLRDLDNCLEIKTAAGGDEALQLMRGEQFDLILLDIVMPKRHGWSVLEEKQSISHQRDTPVLITSAQDPDVQGEDSSLFAMTTGNGIPVDFILENAFRLASKLLKPTATPDRASQETAHT